MESFAAGEAIESAAIDPSGTHVAVVGTALGKRVLLDMDLAAGTTKAILAGDAGHFRLESCEFKNEQRLLCRFAGVEFMHGEPFWTSRLYALNSDGSDGKVLVQNGRAGAAQFQDRIVDELEDDPRHVLIQLDDDRNVYPSVFRLDVYTGQLTKVLQERTPITHWFGDGRGVVRFGYGYQSTSGEAQYVARDTADSHWRVLLKFDRFDQAAIHVLGFGDEPDALIVSETHGGRRAIWEMDLRDNREKHLLFSHPEVDAGGIYQWPGSNSVVGFFYATERPQLKLVDARAAAVHRALDALLPDTFNEVIGGSRDATRLLVHASSDVNAGTYFVLDTRKSTAVKLGAARPELAAAPLAPMKSVQVPGPGGIRIPGYLTLPVGSTGRGLPTIVMPHGGPYARDVWGFDPLLQMLVSRGYAVLQLNFRGSTGYGAEWFTAGYQGWGTVMHEDITAGAHWLVESGIADPKRMCIVGWSYGGYAALIGGIKEPALYRCIVSIAGVGDLSGLQSEYDRFYGGRYAVRASIGAEDLKANSPRRRAAEIRVPVLLVHGDRDTQSHVSQSRDMAKALERAGRPYELVVIEDGDHALSRPEWRLLLYRKLEVFLGQHLGPG
ncbi:MAG: S9 family peptidase [Steroidobacteraceae bacterium]